MSPAALKRALDPAYIGSPFAQPFQFFDGDASTPMDLTGRAVVLFLDRQGLPDAHHEIAGTVQTEGRVLFSVADTSDWIKGDYSLEVRLDGASVVVGRIAVAKGAAANGSDMVGASQPPTAPGVVIAGSGVVQVVSVAPSAATDPSAIILSADLSAALGGAETLADALLWLALNGCTPSPILRDLIGGVVISGVATGALSVAAADQVLLSGAISSASSATGSLTVGAASSIALVGTAVSTSSLTGAMTVVMQIALTGAASGSSAVAGSLTVVSAAFAPVATGGDILDTNGNNMTALNSRSYHIATEDLTTVQFVYPAFYVTNFTDTGIVGVNTFKAGIEKADGSANLGTVTGGAYTADGNWFVTNPLTLSQAITRGSAFFVRSYITGSHYAYAFNAARAANTAAGERMDFAFNGAALTDRSGLTGTFTNGNAGAVVRPFAILGATARKSVLIVGDSIGTGQADVNDASGHRGYIARPLGEALVAYSKVSIPGEMMSQLGAKRVTGKQWFSDVICEYGVNDISASGLSSAQLQSRLTTLWSKFSDKRVFHTTLTPESTGTYTSDAGQSPRTGWEPGGVWAQLNAYIKTVPAPLIAVFDANALAESPTKAGVWRSDGGVARVADGIHPLPVSVQELKAAINTAAFTT